LAVAIEIDTGDHVAGTTDVQVCLRYWNFTAADKLALSETCECDERERDQNRKKRSSFVDFHSDNLHAFGLDSWEGNLIIGLVVQLISASLWRSRVPTKTALLVMVETIDTIPTLCV